MIFAADPSSISDAVEVIENNRQMDFVGVIVGTVGCKPAAI
jgi:hypothetical protein